LCLLALLLGARVALTALHALAPRLGALIEL
jgi:hypothetical protein